MNSREGFEKKMNPILIDLPIQDLAKILNKNENIAVTSIRFRGEFDEIKGVEGIVIEYVGGVNVFNYLLTPEEREELEDD